MARLMAHPIPIKNSSPIDTAKNNSPDFIHCSTPVAAAATPNMIIPEMGHDLMHVGAEK